MYRIIDSRGSGKTSRLMLIAKQHNAVFICANPRAMEIKARAYGIIGIDFISYADAITFECDRYVVVDEIENFVSYILKNKDKMIGFTVNNGD